MNIKATVALFLAIWATSIVSCTKECELLVASADIQSHLSDIEGKWIINKRSSIFDAGGSNCQSKKDTAYISTKDFGFDVLLITNVGTDCRFVDSIMIEGIQVLAQHDGKFVYQPPIHSMDYHFDVEVVPDTIYFHPLDTSIIDSKIIGFFLNNRSFELIRRER